jgi:glycine cleavage system H lipoate-binding protein
MKTMTEQPWAEVPEEQWAQMVGDSVATIGATEQLAARMAAVLEASFSASCR